MSGISSITSATREPLAALWVSCTMIMDSIMSELRTVMM